MKRTERVSHGVSNPSVAALAFAFAFALGVSRYTAVWGHGADAGAPAGGPARTAHTRALAALRADRPSTSASVTSARALHH